jgi:hypothetical protein
MLVVYILCINFLGISKALFNQTPVLINYSTFIGAEIREQTCYGTVCCVSVHVTSGRVFVCC